MTVPFQLTIDCQDADRLARFWAEALGYEPPPPPDGHADWRSAYLAMGVPDDELEDMGIDRLVDPVGNGPKLWFQQVPEGKATKNRLHLDLFVSGGRAVPIEQRRAEVDAEVARLIALGATKLRELGGLDDGYYAVTLQDPEGNEFCVV